MNKQIARNALVVVGAWALSATIAMLIALVLIPLNNRLTFRGDTGVVIMWVWSGLPKVVTAVGATLAVLWLIDNTKRPYAWVCALAALYLYAALTDAVRTCGGRQSAPTVNVKLGIFV